MYQLLRKLFFLFPPEDVHHFSMHSLHKLASTRMGENFLRKQFCWNKSGLETKAFGLTFKNPVGLAAGFDKNAVFLKELELLGFSHVEIGTVTPKPQPGNDQPRLFRLPEDKALINRMGFNNNGVKAVRGCLEMWKNKQVTNFIVGANIGKNKVTENEDAWKDYETCFRELQHAADYFVVNVSSPNTPGLRALQDKDALLKILANLQDINQGSTSPKPLLLKIAPDLTQEQLDDIVSLAFEVKLDGLVATNTTISREGLNTKNAQLINQAGGLSGAPVFNRSTEVLQYLSQQTNNQIPIIASGGIFNGEQAQAKLKAGAVLVQVYTGFIYEGPAIVKNICSYLASLKK